MHLQERGPFKGIFIRKIPAFRSVPLAREKLFQKNPARDVCTETYISPAESSVICLLHFFVIGIHDIVIAAVRSSAAAHVRVRACLSSHILGSLHILIHLCEQRL